MGKVVHHDTMAKRSSPARGLLPEDVDHELFEHGRRLRQLSLRIRDDELRSRYSDLNDLAIKVTLPHPAIVDGSAFMVERFSPATRRSSIG